MTLYRIQTQTRKHGEQAAGWKLDRETDSQAGMLMVDIEVKCHSRQTLVKENKMKLTKLSLTFLSFTAAMLLVAAGPLPGAAQTTPSDQSLSTSSDDSIKVKIARAMSAGPAQVANVARIVETDAQGKMVVLREGNNGFTCMPGNLKVVGEPPMCVDAAAMQWYDDAKAHKPKPTNTVPAITYMLAGATQRSDSDPHDTTSMPIEIGPH
jgi:hypothetical protein